MCLNHHFINHDVIYFLAEALTDFPNALANTTATATAATTLF
jgi:hypothetical protein